MSGYMNHESTLVLCSTMPFCIRCTSSALSCWFSAVLDISMFDIANIYPDVSNIEHFCSFSSAFMWITLFTYPQIRAGGEQVIPIFQWRLRSQ